MTCIYYLKITCTHRYDSRVKAMEVDEKPTETYGDIGGLDKQIEEVCSCYLYLPILSLSLFLQLVEAIVLPMTHKEKFENIGIQPPKGIMGVVVGVSYTTKYRRVIIRTSWNWKDSPGKSLCSSN